MAGVSARIAACERIFSFGRMPMDRLSSQAQGGLRRLEVGGHPPLRGHLRALVRPRHHRGPADGPRRALVRDRHARRRGDRARRPDALVALLRAAAQGRRLLEQRGQAVSAVRGRRLRAQARPQADRPPAPVRGAQVHRPPRPRPPARRDRPQRRRGRARDDRAALRARRRHRAHDRAQRGHRRGDQGARRALGRQRLSLRHRRRRDPAARPHRLPRPDRRGVLRRRRPARRRSTSPPSAAVRGSTPRSSTRCAPPAATARSGARSAATSRTR